MLMNKSFFSPNLNLIRISISSVFRRNFAQTSVSRRTMQKSAVIMDLDGTLLDTESVVDEVLQDFLAKKYGKTWDGRGDDKRLGKRPLEACASIIEDYELPCTPEHLMSETSPLFENMWSRMKPLPGAVRLIKHLTSHDVPIALASNSPRNNIEAKLSYQQGWKDSFKVIVAGDEVYEGKPAPEIYLKAAKQLQADPQSCLVIEDSLPGVRAGKAAGMEVVAVPSIPKQAPLYTEADSVLSSLLDLQLEIWGLPPFEDWIEKTLPIEPWYVAGPVIKGFGRGSKVLGIPTANLSAEASSSVIAHQACGVYFGWARLSSRGIYKMVTSIGWNPYFNNTQKTIEPWLLHQFNEDFYGEELRLIVVGYIRPEANFPSLEALIEQIHDDKHIAEAALDLPPYLQFREDPFLMTYQVQQIHRRNSILIYLVFSPRGYCISKLGCILCFFAKLGNASTYKR